MNKPVFVQRGSKNDERELRQLGIFWLPVDMSAPKLVGFERCEFSRYLFEVVEQILLFVCTPGFFS